MQDFDKERDARASSDRRIKIGGREFGYRAAVAPEAILSWNDAVTGKTELDENGWLELFDRTILAILDPGQDDAWREVRAADRDHPLNLDDIKAVLHFLIAEATGRPTGEPSGSSPGSSSTETPSREESSPSAEASTD